MKNLHILFYFKLINDCFENFTMPPNDVRPTCRTCAIVCHQTMQTKICNAGGWILAIAIVNVIDWKRERNKKKATNKCRQIHAIRVWTMFAARKKTCRSVRVILRERDRRFQFLVHTRTALCCSQGLRSNI